MFWPFNPTRSAVAGFTLIEMLVVMAIFIIITGVVLANLPRFRDRTNLDLVAQEVAILIRQAQAYGTATRRAGESFNSYGVHLRPGQAPAEIVLFTDRDANSTYDQGGTCGTGQSECLEVFRLRGGVEFVGWEACGSDLANCEQNDDSASVLFKRPTVDALFNPLVNSNKEPVSHLRLTIRKQSNPDDTRAIVVWNSGHIYVE